MAFILYLFDTMDASYVFPNTTVPFFFKGLSLIHFSSLSFFLSLFYKPLQLSFLLLNLAMEFSFAPLITKAAQIFKWDITWK